MRICTMFWVASTSGDRLGFAMARRHYSADKNKHPKQRQFVGPGEKMVLVGWMCQAVFAWCKSIRDDGQTGVNCTIFRNESQHRSSDMILEAMELAWERWPGERLFTFVNPKAVASCNPGYCFLMAGWKRCGKSKKGLVVLDVFPSRRRP
jgi:hypothetical protein